MLLLAPSLALGAWSVDGKPKISFHADGPAGFAIDGIGSELSVSQTETAMVFTVPMASLTTDIDLRDEHMLHYTEATVYPDLVLTIPLSELKLPGPDEKKSAGIAQGTFSLHGVDKPAKVKYAVKKDKTGVTWVAGFNFNTEDHGIEIPEYMGVTADPAMSAQARFHLVDQ